MKFYYNGKLLRTSKTHHYTHAIVDVSNDALVGCRSDYQAAVNELNSWINNARNDVEYYEKYIAAIKRGAKQITVKSGRRSFPVKVDHSLLDKNIESLAASKNYLKNIMENWKVVELEER